MTHMNWIHETIRLAEFVAVFFDEPTAALMRAKIAANLHSN